MNSTLHIQTTLRNGITYLGHAHFTTPLKVANITEDKQANPLHLMIMSASPGILDGDRYDLTVNLCEGSSLRLHTQSYQRLFNMKACAEQSLEVLLASNCSFCFLPHPSVPHTASVFRSTNKIYLADNCSLVFGEILTCGRKLNGEVFMLSSYHNTIEVFVEQKLIIKENLLIEPAVLQPGSMGQLEEFTHQASLIYLHATAETGSLTVLVNALLNKEEGILYGITDAPVNGLLIRILGHKAEQLHNCLQNINKILPQLCILKSSTYAV